MAVPSATGSKAHKTGDIKVNDQVTDLGKTDVIGKIYKPDVFYVVTRAEISHKGMDLNLNFVPRIFKNAMSNPF